MPFDDLSSFVRNGNGSASPSRGFQLGKVVGPSFSFFFFLSSSSSSSSSSLTVADTCYSSSALRPGAAAGASSTSALETRRAATIPDAPQELVVSVSTSDRKKSTTVSQVLKRKSPGERKELNVLDPDKVSNKAWWWWCRASKHASKHPTPSSMPGPASDLASDLASSFQALKLLQGKEDFILFDKLDDALKGGKVVVIASEKGDRVSPFHTRA